MKREEMMENLLSLESVMEITSLTHPSICKYLNEGRFPEFIELGNGNIAWFAAELYQWIKDYENETGEQLQTEN